MRTFITGNIWVHNWTLKRKSILTWWRSVWISCAVYPSRPKYWLFVFSALLCEQSESELKHGSPVSARGFRAASAVISVFLDAFTGRGLEVPSPDTGAPTCPDPGADGQRFSLSTTLISSRWSLLSCDQSLVSKCCRYKSWWFCEGAGFQEPATGVE